MNDYPTEDGFKDERQEPEEDQYLVGWYYTEVPCPECGGAVQQLTNDFGDITEIQKCCMSCEYFEVFYE